MTNFINVFSCWCGSKMLEPFSEYYQICRDCGTLVANIRSYSSTYKPGDEGQNLYSKAYWTEHVKEEYGFPDIFERSRLDLTERCLYWLKNIIKYKFPPVETLELGCAPGGLVYLMKLAGFTAHGAEMSPWICNYAANTFDIPMHCGRVEDLSLAPKSLDMIILMDVLEHMTDPVGALNCIAEALKDDGIVVIQTPCYNSTQTYEMMKQKNDVFLEQLKEKEHLYLFSIDSIEIILRQTGFRQINFEHPLFPYDMFLFAGKSEFVKYSEDNINNYLLKAPNGRITLALLDLFDQKTGLIKRLIASEADRSDRLRVIGELETKLEESEADRSNRLKVINELDKRLKESELDRGARLKIIEQLKTKLEESEADRSDRLQIINELEEKLRESNMDRKALLKTTFKLETELNDIKKHWLYWLIKGKEPER